MGGNFPINGNKSINNSAEFPQIKFGAKRTEMKSNQQRSIFDKLDTNKDGLIDEKDKSVVNGKVKNKEGKFVEKRYIKLQDLPNGRSLVLDENGKQWVRAHDGTILKESYAKYDEKSGKVDVKKQQDKTKYNASADKLKALNSLIKSCKSARADFDKQLAKDGWAGDLADGISKLWNNKLGEKMGINTGNTASQVRDYLKEYDKNMNALKKAAQKGDAEFEAEFKKIYGKNFSKEALKEIQDAVTKRIDDYNQSQQTGATAVKTTGKIAAGAAIGVATGGTGLAALTAAAAATAATSVAIEESDSAHITGEHKDSTGKTVKDEGAFRQGTDHGKILKDAAIDGAAVLAGGAVGKAAQVVAKGRKAVQVGATVAGDVATGAVQEKFQTGEVTLAGTLMNAGMSGVGSAASTGLLKSGFSKIKKTFANATDGVSKKFSTPKSQMPKGMNNSAHIPANDPDADLNRFLNMGDLVARGTNDEPKQGFWSRLFGGKKSTSEPIPSQNQSNTVTYGGRTFKKATPRKATGSADAGIVIVNRPKSKSKIESQSQIIETAKPKSTIEQSQEIKYNHWQHDDAGRTTLVSLSLKVEKRSDGRIFLRDNEGYIKHRLADGEYAIIENSGRANKTYQKLENVDGQMVVTDVTERDYKQYIVDQRGIKAGAIPTQNMNTEQNVRYVYDDGLATKGTSGPVSRNHTHFVENGKYIDVSHGELDIDYEVYTASGNVKRTMKLDKSGIIDMPNGAQHDLVKDGPYYYSEDVGGKSFKKIEYENGRVKISNATKEEYNASINKQVANASVKQSISIESLGDKTIDVKGTNYSITGHPKGVGFAVKNKITGEYNYVEKGEKITFSDGTTAFCSSGAGDNVKISIIAQRPNT